MIQNRDTLVGAVVGHNALHPDRMTASERLGEVSEILALGLVRLRARKSSPLSRDSGESSLHLSPAKSVHAPPISRRRPA